MAINPHPPYTPDLASCDLFLFPQIELKLKGHRFDTTKEIQAESQRTSRKRSKKWRGWCDRCEGTTSSVMAADRLYGEFYDFYSVSPQYLGYHTNTYK
jgi:hypothetical protein